MGGAEGRRPCPALSGRADQAGAEPFVGHGSQACGGAPYDAELFGHWWFEGPRWLDYLIRGIALDQSTIRLVTLSEYLDEYR